MPIWSTFSSFTVMQLKNVNTFFLYSEMGQFVPPVPNKNFLEIAFLRSFANLNRFL